MRNAIVEESVVGYPKCYAVREITFAVLNYRLKSLTIN